MKEQVINEKKKNNCFYDYCINTGNENLLDEWDNEKNEIAPWRVAIGSKRKVWWKCSQNHSYYRSLEDRKKGYGCPYCSNRRVLVGFNDLETVRPDLAKEWDYEKNSVKPSEVTHGSEKKVWWKCSMCGYEWKAVIHCRTQKNILYGCPQCSREQSSSFPEQAIFYFIRKEFSDAINNDRHLGVELDIYIPSLNTAIEYDGMLFHEKERDLRKDRICKDNGIQLYRVRENGCEKYSQEDCSKSFYYTYGNISELNLIIAKILYDLLDYNVFVDIEKSSADIYNQYIVQKKEKSFELVYPDIATEWDYEKNKDVYPNMVSHCSTKSVWWKCEKGHSYKMTIANKSKHQQCPVCLNKQILVGYNDLMTIRPDIASSWDYTKNTINPEEIGSGSGKSFWWKCDICGGSWKTSVINRTKSNGTGCPFCSNQKALVGFNDIGTIHPELLQEWDYTLNEISPLEIVGRSNKQIWWKCKRCNNNWKASPNTRISGSNCPYCSGRRVKQGYNDLATLYPNLAKEWDYERNTCSPTAVTAGSNKKVWWKCSKCHNEWEAIVANRKKGNNCPFCANVKCKKGYNDLKTYYPYLSDCWNYEKNKENPSELIFNYAKKVWWKCRICENEWNANIKTVRNHPICPKCKSSLYVNKG